MPFPRPLGMSTKKDAAAGAPFQPTPVRASNPNNNDQRQGIIVAMVSCLLLFLTAYGILGLVQQILLMYLSRVFYRFSDFLLEKGRIKLNPQQLWIFEKDI